MLSPHQIVRLNDLYRGFKLIEATELDSFPEATMKVFDIIGKTQKLIYKTKENSFGTAIQITVAMNYLQEKEKLIMWEFCGQFDDNQDGMWIHFLDVRGRDFKVFIEPGDL